MSKKHRRQKQRKSFPWPLVAIGGILLIAAAFLFAKLGGDGGGTPSIAVDQQKIDYGDQHFGASLTFEIKVTNTGTGTLRFKEKPYVEIVEGC
jgi:H+/Cl- antiporter ClcA